MYGNKILRIAEGQDGNSQVEPQPGADGSPESGERTPEGNQRSSSELSSLAQLNCTAEQLQAAVEIEIDKCFSDLAALAKSNFKQAITRPLGKRERKLAKKIGK